MIARISILLILLIVIPDLFVDRRFFRKSGWKKWSLKRIFWWLPGVVMLIYTVVLSLLPGFAPSDMSVVYIYLFLLGLIVVPKFVFMLCSLIGLGVRRLCHVKGNYGNVIGILLVIAIWYILFYGSFVGFNEVAVRNVTYESSAIPQRFDGYRIVQFSDAHVGTYGLSRQHILKEFVDTINAQRADLIVFTGDLQNREPSELLPHFDILSSLKARDGVISILGNHDYAKYLMADDAVKEANEKETQRLERQMGWHLLLNEHKCVYRGNDSIVIAGMENDGDGNKFPQKGDTKATLKGTSPSDFIIMLEHDPSSWRRKILPETTAQLTLSGHTHAMQFELFGWSPASFVYTEWGGMFYEGERAINVSTGMGGFLPFRFGVPGEIVIITLKTKK